MDKQLLVGTTAVVMGLVVIAGSGHLVRRASAPDHFFGRANRAHPVFARFMPLFVGAAMTVMGVLVLTGVMHAR
ncbi:hypothetical protein [Streptomyces sp. NPDC047014]|uniref:hypothetical protein n=1 Tax=Streptomyces sp. NPDC047014 TaxID=3155736 RepID=UPI0033CD3133